MDIYIVGFTDETGNTHILYAFTNKPRADLIRQMYQTDNPNSATFLLTMTLDPVIPK